MVRVKLDDPHMTQEQSLMLPGLGMFFNGRARHISQEEVERYERKSGRSLTDAINAHPYLTLVEETEEELTPGPVQTVDVEEETPSPRRRRRGDSE